MPKVALYSMSGEQLGEVDLNEDVFGVPVHRQAMHDAVTAHLARRRRGTHDTKTRAQVSGSGKKPWRQKGTGRARSGSRQSPIWKGGGVVFGPHPRDYGYKLPKKIRRLALKSALSSKVEAGEIKVLDALTMDQPKTKDMASVLKKLAIDNKAVIVTAGNDQNVYKSARNLPGVKSLSAGSLNVYDLLSFGTLVITKDAVSTVEEVLTR
ncbi:MAG: 50S ribosomal protein L4 [Firmicutes bacterium]|nr:50S ribosomal protein L4 [Bacillota bacterium]